MVKFIFTLAESLVPIFCGVVGGLYIYQVLHTPQPIFTRRECWVIGSVSILIGLGLSLGYRFQWFEKLDRITNG